MQVHRLGRVGGLAISLVRRASTRQNQAARNGFSMYKHSENLDLTLNATSEVASYSGDLLCVPFFKMNCEESEGEVDGSLKKSIPQGLHTAVLSTIGEIIDDKAFTADADTKAYVTRISGRGGRTKHIALVGLGTDPSPDGELDGATARKLGSAIAALSKETMASNAGVVAPTGGAFTDKSVQQLLLGVHAGAYTDTRYREPTADGFPAFPLQGLELLGASENLIADATELNTAAKQIASGVSFAKDLVGAPPNSKFPQQIAALASELSKDFGLECVVLGQKECEERNMGAYLAVQQGSRFEPAFVHLTYKPKNATGDVKKVALVGKGLTFDSGGYNLKVGAGSMIELMKFDMGGCSAVLGAAKAIGQLQPEIEVHFITALCENMVSADAVRPGDIVKASNGKTIEVLNTDAEGRLTLADALVYADGLGCDTIIDLATLTGAAVVALGEDVAAVYSNDDALSADLMKAATESNTSMWPMPLHADYRSQIKGNLSNLKNIGDGRGGGSITAALFLEEFVKKDTKWAHIDMAGPVWDSKKTEPTGFGVALLVEFLLARQSR